MDHKQTVSGHVSGFPWKHLIGYILSIVLTVLAAVTAFNSGLSPNIVIAVIFILAILQAALQLLMFMHMTESSSGKIQTGTILFAIFIAITLVAGSVWVLSSGHS